MSSILIIGADRGLGLGLARELFGRGWSVAATALPDADPSELEQVGASEPSRLFVTPLDITDAGGGDTLLETLGERRFDVIFSVAGIWGARHQSVVQATDAEFAEVMLVNAFGPVRLAHELLDRLAPRGSYGFMTSHRASVALNAEGGIELYRASKVALNMLAHGLWAKERQRALTMLLIHPGWVNTEMGTLGGTVEAEIELEPSVRGVADVIERHRGSGEILYRDWQDQTLPW